MSENSEPTEKQDIENGHGPLFHRRYSIRFPADPESIHEAMADLQVNLDKFSPSILAKFEKTKGDENILKPGDEFLVHITGPWNGPVRVTEVQKNSFTLVTLDGHLEAGEIQFHLKKTGSCQLTFEIESIARSRDAIVDFVYDKIPIARFAQTEMWTEFCKNFAKHVETQFGIAKADNKCEDVEIFTERFNPEKNIWEEL